MNKPILITQPIAAAAVELLQSKGYEVEMPTEDRVMSPEELAAKVVGRQAVLCLLSDRIDARILDQAQGVRIFANYAVGFDNIDVAAATARKIAITNTPGVLTEATAQLTWALILATCRHVVAADHYLRAGHFQHWGPLLFLGLDLQDKILGIVGAGRIGQAVGRIARAFGMRCLYTARHSHADFEQTTAAVRVGLAELLSQSDVVSLHLPLTTQTHHLIGAAELARMKPTAYLINTSRGAVVDEAALVQALQSKRIAGAGLDVYEHEPKVHPGLLQLDQVVLLPHIGSATYHTRTRMATMAAENIVAMLEGRRPPNLVNPEIWQEETV